MTIGELARLILVVDDEAAVRTGITQALGKLGFEVQTAATGAEGLRLMAARPAGIVLLDVRLPDLDGYGGVEAACARTTPTSWSS